MEDVLKKSYSVANLVPHSSPFHQILAIVNDMSDSLLPAKVDHSREVGDILALVETEYLEIQIKWTSTAVLGTLQGYQSSSA